MFNQSRQQPEHKITPRERYNAQPHKDPRNNLHKDLITQPSLSSSQRDFDTQTQPQLTHLNPTPDSQIMSANAQQAGGSGGHPNQSNVNTSGGHQDEDSDESVHSSPVGNKGKARQMESDASKVTETLDERDYEIRKSKWIHRDNLEEIERQEMEEAGINVPPAEDRPLSRRTHNRRARIDNATLSQTINLANYFESVSGPSTGTQSYRAHERGQGERSGEQSPQTPPSRNRSIDGEGSPQPVYRQARLRSSSSRIPLATTSPMPISQEHLDRTTPLPRRRAVSVNVHSGDEDDFQAPTASPSAQVAIAVSSPRIRSSSQTNAPPAQSKSSAAPRDASDTQKPRTVSANVRGSPAPRAAARAISEGRPQTAVNRPEGEAPWIADMYKPDPRIHPDQQLLPTFAKRLAQERERLAKLATQSDHNPQASRNRGARPSTAEPWGDRIEMTPVNTASGPSKTTSRGPVSRGPVSPSKSPGGAGYSTIPRVTTPSIAPPPARPSPQHAAHGQSPTKQQPQQGEEEAQGKKERKGCGCCVVM